MNSPIHASENTTVTVAPEMYTFSHEGIIFGKDTDGKDIYGISLSQEAQVAFALYVTELQSTFESYEEIEFIDEEIVFDTANQVAEIMKEEGKEEKIIKRFLKRVNKLLSGNVKEKKVEKLTRKVERKFKKFHPNQRKKIQIQYKDDSEKIIDLLPMSIWPDTDPYTVVKGYNILLSNDRRRIEKENGTNQY